MATSKRTSAIVVIVLIAAIVALIGGLLWRCGCSGAGSTTRAGRTATIIAVNDIYRIDGVAGEGGLHRLRGLRKEIEKTAPKALLLHAGDFLAPSLESKVFKGEQMIEAMNYLDGDPKKFDDRMFVAFGNHEFDDSECGKSPSLLTKRIAESQFTWLISNFDVSNCASLKDLMTLKNVKKTEVVSVNGIRVGIFAIGLTPDQVDGKDTKRYPVYINEFDAARDAIKQLRANKAEIIVGLTHLDQRNDRTLLRALSEDGLDLVIGGHDHDEMKIEINPGDVRGFKADSDARSAWRIDVSPGKPKATIKAAPIRLTDATAPPDQAIKNLATTWAERTERKICADLAVKSDSYNPKCLQQDVGKTKALIELDERANRSRETGFGDWLTDIVKEKTQADVVVINSGVLGLNRTLPAGTMITARDTFEIFRYDDVVAVRKFKASVICETLKSGFARPGTGAWPHVAGATITEKAGADPGRKDLEIKFGEKGCDADSEMTVAGLPYTLCGGDGYPFKPAYVAGPDLAKFNSADCMDALKREPEEGKQTSGTTMRTLAEQAIRGSADGIEPKIDNRTPFHK